MLSFLRIRSQKEGSRPSNSIIVQPVSNAEQPAPWSLVTEVSFPFLRAIFLEIAKYLSNSDILRLQETCKTFGPIVDEILGQRYNFQCQRARFSRFQNIHRTPSEDSTLFGFELLEPNPQHAHVFGLEVEEWKKVNPAINSKLLYYLAHDKRNLMLNNSRNNTTMAIVPPSSLPFFHPYANRDRWNLWNWWACIKTLYMAPEWMFYYSLSSMDITRRGTHISYDRKYHPFTKNMIVLMRHTLLYVHFAWFALATFQNVDLWWGLLWKVDFS